jgi:hypothetical protein
MKEFIPPEFGVSPTFNISDLKPYMGEEDELESRMTPIQEGEDDEDISPLHTMQGPITRACACVVGQNPPASSDRQHEEPGGSRDCWWAPVPRSTSQDLAHILASGLLGVPPNLAPDQEGVIC